MFYIKLKISIRASIRKKMNLKKKCGEINKDIDDINFTPYAPLNLVVLTANPLMDGEKELRTMNDFNMITSEIYKSFEEEDYLKYTKFLPLTCNNLKNIISNEETRPVILHLICKSTYIIPEQEKDKKLSENSEDYANLIFEDDKNYYNLEFINKKKLENEIFNYDLDPELKEKVKKIILIISTPLAMDTYNIFKNFGFKNILIQHTTLADVNFVANFNYRFYKDIIIFPGQPIINIYEDSLNYNIDDINPSTFCCCFHKHTTTCELVNNLKNELYNGNQLNDINDLKELIPHFYHLFPDCYYSCTPCKEKFEMFKSKIESIGIESPENSFCCHFKRCLRNYKYLPKKKKEDEIIINIPKEQNENMNRNNFIYFNFCCCKEVQKIHNINYIFQNDFSAENKNNEVRFRMSKIMEGNQHYIPTYDKMISFIGNNKVTFKILKFLSSEKDKSLNIYGDTIENLKKFGDVIIEYYRERSYLFESNNKSSKINLKEDNSNNNIINEGKINKIGFVQINLNNEEIDNLEKDKINNNKIYFVYVNNINLIDKIKINYNKVIWFSEVQIDNNKIEINESIQFNKEPILNNIKYYINNANITPNEYIKFQHLNMVRNGWRKKNL